MASRQATLKRRLPSWMETVHNQHKKVPEAVNHILCCPDEVCTEMVHSKLHPPAKLNQDATNVTHNLDIETSVTPSGWSFASAGTSNNTSSNMTAGEVIAKGMPLLAFKGRVIYSCHYDDCCCLCEEILSGLSESKKTPIGFDMEWPVTFQKGSSIKASLIQLCMSAEICYIFHVSAMPKFPVSLRKLIHDARILFVGLNIVSDMWKLERDYDVRVKPIIDRGSVIDIGKLANEKMKSSEHWSLDGLCRNVLRHRLNKDVELRCGDWNEVPLSNEQRLYAASDALAGYLLYESLKDNGS
uniref:3'-5' exonuclease n=1 Tax=Arion vulgaris TaxID=1028688 RepID=A0A0B7AL76_9EUPU